MPQSALAIEEVFRQGESPRRLPDLLIGPAAVDKIVSDRRVPAP
jgi:hypothetical protein